MLVPQCLFSVVYRKGQYVFCCDGQQLPPIVLGQHMLTDSAAP